MTQNLVPTPESQGDLVRSLHQIVRSGEELIAMLSALKSRPRSFDGSAKDQLLHIIARIEALTSVLETRVGSLTRAETQMWIDRLELLFDTWAKIDDQVDRTVALAIIGTVERGFLLLSPIVNCGNLSEHTRLAKLSRRLDERIRVSTRTCLSKVEVVEDPDLASFRAVVFESIGPIPQHGVQEEGTLEVSSELC